MLTKSLVLVAVASGFSQAASVGIHARAHLHLAERATANAGSGSLTLDQAAVQSGSFVDGSKQIGAAEVGQALSATSTDNFINFCSGQTLTNGLQITTGSCNGIPMGQLPAKTSMTSSIITFPLPGSDSKIQSGTTFNISVQMSGIQAGSFTNADATYFAAPQTVSSSGVVIGHTHVSVQDMGNSLNPTTPLDPTQFAFFKGINDAGNGQGLLSATVTGGLPAGNYRVCTMASSSNHAPVIMPVAQRGASDDCTKFVVSGSGTTANVASNTGSGGIAAAAAAALAVSDGPGFVNTATSTSAAAVATSTSSANGQKATAAVSVSATTSAATSTSTPSSGSSSSSAIGGIAAPAVEDSGDSARPFSVNGDSFVNKAAAIQRACSVQFNGCANAVNSGSVSGSTVGDCQTQETTCQSATT